MGTAGHKYQRVPVSETGSTGDMRIRRYVCKCFQDCLECIAFICCCGRLTKLWKYLNKRYAKSNKPSYNEENGELQSIKSESGLANFEIVSMQVQLDQKDNEIHDLKDNVRKLSQEKRQAEMEKQDALTRNHLHFAKRNLIPTGRWYLDENLPNSQALKKALKDGRKAMVPRLLTEIEKRFDTYLCGFCKNASIRPVLTSCEMKEYVSSCVKLSLLMNASDLPIVVDCPGWVPCTPDYHLKQDEHSGVFRQVTVNAEGDESKTKSTLDLKDRLDFNKELFKEYTVRGKYVEFFVWPVMYLHDNGPVLTKGIAQCAEDKMVSDDDHRWEWRQSTDIV
ncbi:hypothetical protein MAR_022494 [Mya arenaria]|uniref:Mitochondria-eating protein C-terminal domain-containing protein n=1 Tax=Mya arenaria TaxID=6604 RepID=A0ABY7DNE8_MYAAR|nr:hypothetical protein MAR_022494 [Mya arenaria]